MREQVLGGLTTSTVPSDCELISLQALGGSVCSNPFEHGIRFLYLGWISGVWSWRVVRKDKCIACLSYKISQETVMSIWTVKSAIEWPFRDFAIRSLPAKNPTPAVSVDHCWQFSFPLA
jgi:hypothetical protein